MEKRAQALIMVFFFLWPLVEPQEVGLLSELPFTELLAQKKILESSDVAKHVRSVASPLVAAFPEEEIKVKELPKLSSKKTFYEEDYDDHKDHHVRKKKIEHKMHDILNTSITALSYLAFGGYLLCMIANAMREKRRRFMMAFPSTGPTMSTQLAHVLQHYASHRPVRPFIRFPAVTIHQGGRKRRREVAEEAPKTTTFQ